MVILKIKNIILLSRIIKNKPKKEINMQYIDMLRKIEKKRVKPRLPYFRYTVMGLLFILPLILTENMVASCVPCQWLIGMMSSIVPGINVMSNASKIPQIVSLELSVMWIMISLLFIYSYYTLYINRKIVAENIGFKRKHYFVFLYIGLLVLFILPECGIYGHSSSYYGTISIFDQHSRRNLFYKIIQNQFGLGVFSALWIVFLSGIFAMWTFMNWFLIKKMKG